MGGGFKFTRNYVHNVIKNPLYSGRIEHRGNLYDGIHDELDQDVKKDLIKILVKEIEVFIKKKEKKGEIKIALWTEFPKGLLSTYKIG